MHEQTSLSIGSDRSVNVCKVLNVTSVYNELLMLFNLYRSECHGRDKYHLTASRAPLLKVINTY